MKRSRPAAGGRTWARRAGDAAVAATLVALSAALGCAPGSDPPEIRRGTACARCGMAVEDLRFACERKAGRSYRVYDSIECLLEDSGPSLVRGAAYLADYDARTLHSADSLWVVRGAFPTPMGGGLAAFRSRASAEEVAARTEGRVGRLREVSTLAGGSRS